ncbi:MAG TPA: class I SAM-dependent methyltransferase [Anaerolineales bacterium]|jgi:ubiquinone/menaquinone biosynthesis C-methylase UbiE|nr:class I SAM-dependent methyltransferase [Anaerolineales bacterium]
MSVPALKMLPVSQYVGVNRDDPIRFYQLPFIGRLYRRRVELCLGELDGGDRVLEVGFGSGVAFFNLSERYSEIHGVDLTADVERVGSFFDGFGLKTSLRNGSVLELPYPDRFFDSVLLISILEHLNPADLLRAFIEIARVVNLGGQVVYGVPKERPLMVLLFKLLGHDIRREHFSTEKDVSRVARQVLKEECILQMRPLLGIFGGVYEVGHFRNSAGSSIID